MRYLKKLLSALVVMAVAAAVIWTGLIVLLFSILAAPMIAWWANRGPKIRFFSKRETKAKTKNLDYKVIEADFKIIEKKD